MELAIILLVFLIAFRKDLLELRSFSLQNEKDKFILKLGLGLLGLALLVAGTDRFVQMLEIKYHPEILFLNDWLRSLPYNDLSVYFGYNSRILLRIIRAVYHYGFFVPCIFLIIRAVARRDLRSLSLLIFSTFAFHYAVHFPFYFFTEGHQIWYVKGIMVPLFRTISPLDHVFPSMHASMSVTSMLLAWRQPNKATRILYSIFCPLVIFSTFYLQIHWTIDAVAGAIIGVAAVKFAEYATAQGWLYLIIARLNEIGALLRRPASKELSSRG
ncbi:MAG: phosphatase PAP2 family protein [Eubacteriales bacterium]|nr:phosphatase PAP2 family protein [Eubacteriales bacterium]